MHDDLHRHALAAIGRHDAPQQIASVERDDDHGNWFTPQRIRIDVAYHYRRSGGKPVQDCLDEVQDDSVLKLLPLFRVAAWINRDSDPSTNRLEGNREWLRRWGKRAAFGMR
jgi:hypothetical protein